MNWLVKSIVWIYFVVFMGKPGLVKRVLFYIPNIKTLFRTAGNELYYLFGSEKGYMPTCVVAELSARCNLDCIMCARHKVMKREQGDMDLETFKKMVDINPQIDIYILVGWGEMMLNRHFFDMVRYLEENGKRIALTTNGTLFTDENIKRITDSGISHITVSMDGIDDVYEKNRQTSFSAVEYKLRALSERIKSTHKDIYLEINSIASPDVLEQAERIKKRLGPLVDEIRFSSCLDYNSLKPTNRTRPCREFWRGMITVLYDGSVVPCCMDYNASMVLGNVKDSPLHELWNNDIARRLRKEHLRLQFKHRCATCYEEEPTGAKNVDKRFD